MPIKRCKLPNGGSGWQYGNQKCYASRQDAIKQMRAIKFSESHGMAQKLAIELECQKLENMSDEEFNKYIEEINATSKEKKE